MHTLHTIRHRTKNNSHIDRGVITFMLIVFPFPPLLIGDTSTAYNVLLRKREN